VRFFEGQGDGREEELVCAFKFGNLNEDDCLQQSGKNPILRKDDAGHRKRLSL
jgi:hypothetical protein